MLSYYWISQTNNAHSLSTDFTPPIRTTAFGKCVSTHSCAYLTRRLRRHHRSTTPTSNLTSTLFSILINYCCVCVHRFCVGFTTACTAKHSSPSRGEISQFLNSFFEYVHLKPKIIQRCSPRWILSPSCVKWSDFICLFSRACTHLQVHHFLRSSWTAAARQSRPVWCVNAQLTLTDCRCECVYGGVGEVCLLQNPKLCARAKIRSHTTVVLLTRHLCMLQTKTRSCCWLWETLTQRIYSCNCTC